MMYVRRRVLYDERGISKYFQGFERAEMAYNGNYMSCHAKRLIGMVHGIQLRQN